MVEQTLFLKSMAAGVGLAAVMTTPLSAQNRYGADRDMNGEIAQFRAAVSWQPQSDSDPVFGMAWFESQVEPGNSANQVRLRDLDVTNTRFPKGAGDIQANFSDGESGWFFGEYDA